MKQLRHDEITSSKHSFSIVVLCDSITLPANIGAVLRLADAFGVEEVIFGGEEVDVLSRKVKQVSRSTHQWIKYSHTPNLKSEINNLKLQAYQIIAMEITDQSQSIHEMRISPDQKIAIVIGSEATGVSQNVLALCSQSVHIPIYGRNTSMNVSNALAVMLYESTRQLTKFKN